MSFEFDDIKIAFYGDSLTRGRTGVSYFSILESRFPEHTLLNFGKSGDTVVSLYRRVCNGDVPSTSVDVMFLWVGVNDILVHASPTFPFIKWIHRQPWSKNLDEFSDYYTRILEKLRPVTKKINCISPLCIGEDFSNRWNRLLGERCEAIRNICENYSDITYIDLRETFQGKFGKGQTSQYIPNSFFRITWDAFMLNSPESIEAVSVQRKLQYTLDGVHLNKRGAEIVADVFEETLVK